MTQTTDGTIYCLTLVTVSLAEDRQTWEKHVLSVLCAIVAESIKLTNLSLYPISFHKDAQADSFSFLSKINKVNGYNLKCE